MSDKPKLSRRDFLKLVGAGGALTLFALFFPLGKFMQSKPSTQPIIKNPPMPPDGDPPQTASSIFYIDSSTTLKDGTPFDGGNGAGFIYSSCSEAYQSSKATGDNHKFYCKRGLFYDFSSNVFFTSFIGKSGCTFDAYGNELEPKPVLDGLYYIAPTPQEDSLWTHSAKIPGAWYREFAEARGPALALWVGAKKTNVFSRPIGDLYRQADTLDDLAAGSFGTKQGIWFAETSKPWRITIYTGSTIIAPPSFWNGLGLVQDGLSASYGLICNGCTDNTFQNFIVRGTSNGGIGAKELLSNVSNCNFKKIDVVACQKNSLAVQGNGDASKKITDLHFEDIKIDQLSGKNAIDFSNKQNNDLILIEDTVSNININRFDIRTGTIHTAIHLSAGKNSLTYTPKNIVLSSGTVLFDNSGDGRGFGIINSDGVQVTDVNVVMESTKSEISGRNISMKNVVWDNMGENSDITNLAFPVVVNNLEDSIQSHNIVFDHCLFDISKSPKCIGAFGLATYRSSSFGLDENELSVINCVAILGDGQGFIVFAPWNDKAQNQNPIASQNISGNYIFRPDGNPQNAIGNLGKFKFTVDQPLNGFIGATNNMATSYDNLPFTSSTVRIR